MRKRARIEGQREVGRTPVWISSKTGYGDIRGQSATWGARKRCSGGHR